MSYPIDIAVKPEVTPFFDRETNTISYVVKDPSSSSCAIIDSVMDIDYAAGRIGCGYGGKLLPSFPTFVLNGEKPTRRAWWLKERILPPVYWHAMLKGKEWMAAPDAH